MNQIIPPLLKLLPNLSKETKLTPDIVIKNLSGILQLFKADILPFLDEIMNVIFSNFEKFDMLELIEATSIALPTEFKIYIPKLIPFLIYKLSNDKSEEKYVALNVMKIIIL